MAAIWLVGMTATQLLLVLTAAVNSDIARSIESGRHVTSNYGQIKSSYAIKMIAAAVACHFVYYCGSLLTTVLYF